jgi:hypothetical protein
MKTLLNAICEDDQGAVRRLLKGDAGLVRAEAAEPELYRGEDFSLVLCGGYGVAFGGGGASVTNLYDQELIPLGEL